MRHIKQLSNSQIPFNIIVHYNKALVRLSRDQFVMYCNLPYLRATVICKLIPVHPMLNAIQSLDVGTSLLPDDACAKYSMCLN